MHVHFPQSKPVVKDALRLILQYCNDKSSVLGNVHTVMVYILQANIYNFTNFYNESPTRQKHPTMPLPLVAACPHTTQNNILQSINTTVIIPSHHTRGPRVSGVPVHTSGAYALRIEFSRPRGHTVGVIHVKSEIATKH